MGDVAMTVPVIRMLIDQHPDLSVTFVSDEKLMPLFKGIDRVDFFGADTRGKFRGVTGLFRLYQLLKKNNKNSAVADLHNVLRTKVLSTLFKLSGFNVASIDKGRAGKKKLTRKQNKYLVQLPTTFQSYADVFEKLGYPVKLDLLQKVKLNTNNTVKKLPGDNEKIRIGLAPFAKHKEKMYPLSEMEKVVSIMANKGYYLYLFGGGVEEINQLKRWEKLYPGVFTIAGELLLEDELILISNLDLMITMDSANMHLASLYGVPVVSIWGATHPFAGFYGFGQNSEYAVQADLFCRPCSVFGNKECYRGDWACMKMITPEKIIGKVEKVLNLSAL